jgi:hypothetical protein
MIPSLGMQRAYLYTLDMGKNMMNVKITSFFIMLLCAAMLTPVHAKDADEKPVPLVAWYGAYWSGLHVGDLVIQVQEDDQCYRFESVLESKGLAKLISRFYSLAKSEGLKSKQGYRPSEYRSLAVLRNKPKDITLRYDATGRIENRNYSPPENRHKRPDVPEEKRDGAFDPLTLVLQSRQRSNRNTCKACSTSLAFFMMAGACSKCILN